ncbi:MAG: hypothetical protein LBQ12_14740 [Deltaproteobacteria bacterium]|jgi:hypothetical protein|nr:hypothetical protein [Deltaproteobacteria bacterium]
MPLQLLASSDLAECHPESPDGVKVVGAYGVLSQLAEDEISPEAAAFLAEPSERPGSIDWHTSAEGDPVPFDSLYGQERDLALDALCTMAAKYQALSDTLAASGSESRATAGKVTSRVAAAAAAAALGARGPKLFMVDGKPVLAGWGLSTAMGGLAALGYELTESQEELSAQILAGERPPIPDYRYVPPPPEPEPEPAPLPFDGQAPQPYYPPQEAAPAWVPPRQPPRKISAVAVLLGVLAGIALLFFLLVFLGFLLEAGYISDGNRAPSAPVQAAAGDELVIPEDAEAGFGFLEGCWQSGGGIVNVKTQLPVIYVHCFADDGTAGVTIDEKTATGEHIDSCVSTATASIEDGVLYIRSSPEGHRCVKDPEHGYGATAVVCRGARGGKAACVIEGSTEEPIDTPFTRLEHDYVPGGSILEGQGPGT